MTGAHGSCPICGSSLLNYPGELVDGEDGTIRLPAECMACGATWLQRYTFSGNEAIEECVE